MLVTIVKETKGGGCREGWVIRHAKQKYKDRKLICIVGHIVLNRRFESASDAIQHCLTELNIPKYRIILGEDAYKDVKKQEQIEQRIKELAEQFLPPSPNLDKLKVMFPGVLEQTLNKTLSKINRAEAIYQKATGIALYMLEEEVKHISKTKDVNPNYE